jgi:hypothetical protein
MHSAIDTQPWVIRLLDLAIVFQSKGNVKGAQLTWEYGVMNAVSVKRREPKALMVGWDVDEIELQFQLADWQLDEPTRKRLSILSETLQLDSLLQCL